MERCCTGSFLPAASWLINPVICLIICIYESCRFRVMSCSSFVRGGVPFLLLGNSIVKNQIKEIADCFNILCLFIHICQIQQCLPDDQCLPEVLRDKWIFYVSCSIKLKQKKKYSCVFFIFAKWAWIKHGNSSLSLSFCVSCIVKYTHTLPTV